MVFYFYFYSICSVFMGRGVLEPTAFTKKNIDRPNGFVARRFGQGKDE